MAKIAAVSYRLCLSYVPIGTTSPTISQKINFQCKDNQIPDNGFEAVYGITLLG
jgi:hypothetical protein